MEGNNHTITANHVLGLEILVQNESRVKLQPSQSGRPKNVPRNLLIPGHIVSTCQKIDTFLTCRLSAAKIVILLNCSK